MSISSPSADAPYSSSIARITPLASLELRLRAIEFLVAGTVDPSPRDFAVGGSSTPILRRIAEVHCDLTSAVEGKSSLERFVRDYDSNLPLLEPDLSLSNSSETEDLDTLSLEAKLALILDSESDILSALRDLEEVDLLDKKGVLGAGTLDSHYALIAPLSHLQPKHGENMAAFAGMEGRLVQLLSRYDDSMSAISETFLDLNALVSQAEDQVSQLERAKARREQGDEL